MFKRNKLCSAMLVAFGGTMAMVAAPTFGQTQLERVEITGSAIRRVESEGALPVQVITRQDIARTGAVNTEALLQSISAISSQGGISTTTGAGSSIYGRATISLRGLSDNRTLILVNGRRVAAFAGGGGAAVDVNNIPIAAIERVEVLKDGASSIYGSDAMAGVINFILTKNYQGAEVSVTAGAPTRSGGGDNQKVSVVGGFGNLDNDRYNVTFSASAEKEHQLFAKDREFAKTGNQPPFLTAAATGQGNIEGAINPVTGVRGAGFGGSPGTGYGNPLAATDSCATINMFKFPKLTSKGLPYCQFDSNGFVALLPNRDAQNISANGTFKLTDSTALFGDFLFGKSTVVQAIQPSPVRRSFLTTDDLFAQQNVVPALLLRPTNPNYQIAADYLTANGQAALVGQTLAITARVFDFGPRTTQDKSTQSRVVGGIRGVVAGQDYEVAYSRNEARTEGSVINGFFSQVGYAKAVSSPTSDWNPWSLSQSAAFNSAIASAEYVGPTLSAKSKSDVLDGKVTGELFSAPGGMTQYAAGAQYRKEAYLTSPSPALGTGDIAGLGGSVPPVDRQRNIKALYGEVSVPVLTSLEATGAVRTDRYDDVGNSTTYKGSVRWQPTKQILVRASYGTGFRAPTLTDLWQPQTLGTSEQFNDPTTNQTDLQVNALSGGNPLLKPEKSKQQSIGFVIQPIESLSIGIDLWKVNIQNVINTPSAQEVVSGYRAGNPTYAKSVTLSPSGDIDSIETLTVNSGDVSASGIDIDARYRMALAGGRLDVNFGGTYVMKFDETSPGGAVSHKVGTIVDANGDPVIGSNTGGVILRWKHTLAATWSTDSWAFTLAQNYTRGYEAGFRVVDGERNFIDSQSLYDAQIAYTGIKNLKLSLGVKNLFDKNPAGVFTPVSNQFQAGYDVTQYDARSRYVYGTASYKF